MIDFRISFGGPMSLEFNNDEFAKLREFISRIESAAGKIAAVNDSSVVDDDFELSLSDFHSMNKSIFIGRMENVTKTLETIVNSIQ